MKSLANSDRHTSMADALERLWLSLNADGIALQPLYGLGGIIFNQRLKVGGFFPNRRRSGRAGSDSYAPGTFSRAGTGNPIIFSVSESLFFSTSVCSASAASYHMELNYGSFIFFRGRTRIFQEAFRGIRVF